MTRLHQSIRNMVRLRAGDRCEYCRKPEAYSPHPPHVDHIIPLKHNGTDDLDNLAWACFQCNVCKGTDFASIDGDADEITRLFNPRTQDWHEHFSLKGAELVGKTVVGRVTIHILQMNHPDQIETRRILIESSLWED